MRIYSIHKIIKSTHYLYSNIEVSRPNNDVQSPGKNGADPQHGGSLRMFCGLAAHKCSTYAQNVIYECRFNMLASEMATRKSILKSQHTKTFNISYEHSQFHKALLWRWQTACSQWGGCNPTGYAIWRSQCRAPGMFSVCSFRTLIPAFMREMHQKTRCVNSVSFPGGLLWVELHKVVTSVERMEFRIMLRGPKVYKIW